MFALIKSFIKQIVLFGEVIIGELKDEMDGVDFADKVFFRLGAFSRWVGEFGEEFFWRAVQSEGAVAIIADGIKKIARGLRQWCFADKCLQRLFNVVFYILRIRVHKLLLLGGNISQGGTKSAKSRLVCYGAGMRICRRFHYKSQTWVSTRRMSCVYAIMRQYIT